MTGHRVLAVLAATFLATAVLPPASALLVNRARVRSAGAVAGRLAAAVRDAGPPRLVAAAGADVLCGAGRMPLARSPQAQAWVTSSRASWNGLGTDRLAPPRDPWGNCYVVNLAAVRIPQAAVWALSAGPDGILDTPFAPPSDAVAGDDVGVRIR